MSLRHRAAATAIVLAVASTWVGTAWAEPLTPCRVPGLSQQVLCGVVARALDPGEPAGVRIAVHFVVVPALARRKLPDPVFMLAGGPGQSAIAVAPTLTAVLGRVNQRRDLVFVDQRGTGRSAPLECPDVGREPLIDASDPERQRARLASCRRQLEALPHVGGSAGLRHYTTWVAMQDLDAVRRELGARQINLVGASYGTRAALEYQRQFPDAVRRSVLDGVVPPDMVLPVSFASDAENALENVLAGCEREPACAQAFPQLRRDWMALLAGLPKTVEIADPSTGIVESVRLTREALVGMVRGPLYLPMLVAGLPAAIDSAARGRFEPLAGLGALLVSRRQPSLAIGMHFSVVCAEDVTLMPPVAAGATAGLELADHYRRVCGDWPRGSVPAAFYAVGRTHTPVLLLSGGADPATPPRHGERMAQALGPQARHVVVPQAGHGLLGLGCMRELVQRFLEAAEDSTALAVDAGCVSAIPRPPAFRPPTRPSAAPP